MGCISRFLPRLVQFWPYSPRPVQFMPYSPSGSVLNQTVPVPHPDWPYSHRLVQSTQMVQLLHRWSSTHPTGPILTQTVPQVLTQNGPVSPRTGPVLTRPVQYYQDWYNTHTDGQYSPRTGPAYHPKVQVLF